MAPSMIQKKRRPPTRIAKRSRGRCSRVEKWLMRFSHMVATLLLSYGVLGVLLSSPCDLVTSRLILPQRRKGAKEREIE